MTKLPELHDVLRYHNPLVIQRFRNNYPQDASKAEQLFIEMLRYS